MRPSARPAEPRRLAQLLDESFSKFAEGKSELAPADLKRALELRGDFLLGRMFAVLDRDGSGSVSLGEYRETAWLLLHGSPQDKIRISFRLHDLDGDGRIDAREFQRMVQLNVLEERERTGASVDASEVDALSRRLFQTVDENGDSSVSYEEFERMALSEPTLLELASRSEARWLLGDADLLNDPCERLGYLGRFTRLLENRRAWLGFLGLWLVGNALLVGYALERYRDCGSEVMLARAGGASLNLNSALILFSVMRGLATKIRGFVIAPLLPLDDALSIHRLLGYSVAVGSVLHGAGHFIHGLLEHPVECAALDHEISRLARPTGWALLLLTAVMVTFALPQIRRTKYFDWFAKTHVLYLPWFVLALLHAPHLRLWVILPIVVFGLELTLRVRRRSRQSHPADLTSLSSKVSRLRLATPPGFSYRAGDYALLKIPSLPSREWHPFTISSAPESGELTFHVRALGNWTDALYTLAEQRRARSQTAPIAVHLDGPYGSPSSYVLAQRHAVMIGAGIGVTPFASVLDSLVTRKNAGDLELEKLYFYWLSADQRSFDWFRDLLLELEQKDQKSLVDIRIFLSRARASFAALALNLARDLAHDVGRPDAFTGLRAQTRVGEPDFERELREIAERHAPDKVDVFYCGRPELGRKLRKICTRLGLSFRPEPF
jgi:predicted ferric reductase/Ca2+-binding EF-hand superfamily protein